MMSGRHKIHLKSRAKISYSGSLVSFFASCSKPSGACVILCECHGHAVAKAVASNSVESSISSIISALRRLARMGRPRRNGQLVKIE